MYKYKWEEKALEKYGKKITRSLINRENERDDRLKEQGNGCKGCGYNNQGVLLEFPDGSPLIMHYGLWIHGTCQYCGRYE